MMPLCTLFVVCVAQVFVVRHRGERCTFTRVGKDAYLVDCAWMEK